MTTSERAQYVGARIVVARKRKGMSQTKLAHALAERTGADPENVRRALLNNETGRHAPRLQTLEAIAEITEQPLGFFTGTGGDGQPFRSGKAAA